MDDHFLMQPNTANQSMLSVHLYDHEITSRHGGNGPLDSLNQSVAD